MEMNLPSFQERFKKCGKAKMAPSGKIPQEECPKKGKIKTKAP